MSKSKILLKVTGSIAAYKSAELLSGLLKNDYEVRVAVSPSALKFVGSATFEGLGGHKVYSDTFESGEMMSHIHLMRWADLIITAPATANYINKCAAGISDDLLSTLFLAHNFDKPYLIAPAMNTSMLQHPITQESIKKLGGLGVEVLATGTGGLACGEVGTGRLLEPEELIEIIEARLASKNSQQQVSRESKRILITSGGTREPIDQVRHLGNKSSGRTGSLLAKAFTETGHQVTYLHAEDAVRAPASSKELCFSSFSDLDHLLKELLSQNDFDVVVHAAAVSDFSLSHLEDESGKTLDSSGKIESKNGLKLVLKPNYKIIDRLKDYSRNKSIQIIGFKLTAQASQDKILQATSKIFAQANATAVVHNDSSEFAEGKHPFHLYRADSKSPTDCSGVEELAKALCQIFETGKPQLTEGELI